MPKHQVSNMIPVATAIVDAGANRKTFFLKKSVEGSTGSNDSGADSMTELEKIIKETGLSEDQITALQALADSDPDLTLHEMAKGRGLNAMLNRLIKAKDETRGDVIASMASAAGIESGTVNSILDGTITCPPINRLEGFAKALGVSASSLITAAEGDGCEYNGDSMEKAELQKIIKESGLTDEQKALLAKAIDIKVEPELVDDTPAMVQMRKQLKAAEDKGDEAVKLAKAETDARQHSELVTLVKSKYSHVPGKPEDHARLIKSARDRGEDEGKLFDTFFDSIEEVLKKSALFSETGSGLGGNPSPSAEFEALTKAYKESNKDATTEQAFNAVYRTTEGKKAYTEGQN